MTTPRRGSPTGESIKLENAMFSGPITSLSDVYGVSSGFDAMNIMTQEMIHQNQALVTANQPLSVPQFDLSYVDYGPLLDEAMSNPYFSHHGLPLRTPSMEHNLFSSTSDLRRSTLDECVVPSQTTRLDPFSISSPSRPMQFTNDYPNQSPGHELISSMSECSPQSMGYMAPDYTTAMPTPKTPCRDSVRREGVPSNATLLDYQNQPKKCLKTERGKKRSVLKTARRQNKQKQRRNYMIRSNIELEPASSYTCSIDGCFKKFGKKEHRERHVETHRQTKPPFICEFCKRQFPGARRDNFTVHLLRHTIERGPRTEYDEKAQAVYDALRAKQSKCTRRKPKKLVKEEEGLNGLEC